MRLDINRVGQLIKDTGLPRDTGPLIFVIVGNGNVSNGVKWMLNCLPVEWISPTNLPSLSTSKNFMNDRVYACQVESKDFIIDKNGSFDKQEYYKHPERYSSVFHSTIAPYASMIVNGILWGPKFPRLISKKQMIEMGSKHRLLSVADITCDIDVK